MPELPPEPALPRMRVRKGRVMHRVRRASLGGHGGFESLCRRGSGIRGVKTTYARASGAVDDWSALRYWYPDCRHCPPEEPAAGSV